MTEPDPLDSSCAPLPALTNNLSEQASRYYRLHQQQPVAWQIWSDDTFLLAQKYNKPILLLIGYSSCHWCHVMSRDSFEDIETARLMNDHFINICIDREERPDIDSAYQLSHILLNGHSGGWPLIGFLCPYTRLPFFSGTYLPQQGSSEKLGFPQLLQKVHHYYEQQPTDMRRLLMQLQSGIERLSLPLEPTAVPDDSLLSEALEALAATQDNDYGGFGSSPKFPQPVNLSFLLQCHARARLSLEQMGHLTQTLTLIAERGINDRISGGFFRYSIDDAWAQPHFEKMLYDNGLLLQVYARAYSEFKDPLYKSATLGIVRWLRHNMLAPEGGFYSSVDADAGGVEGGHYLISRDDIERELSAQEFELFKMLFALECDSTDPSPVYLSQVVGLEYCARALSLSPDKGLELYQSGRKKLQHILHQNPSVEVDDKILSGCNALMIKGLAVAAQVTQDSALVAMAQQAVDFIHSKLWLNQRLFAGWLQGGVTGHAFLDD